MCMCVCLGLAYLPEMHYRRILLKAFGPGCWGLIPRGEPMHFQVRGLLNNLFCSFAMHCSYYRILDLMQFSCEQLKDQLKSKLS